MVNNFLPFSFLERLTLVVFLPVKVAIDATGSTICIPKLARVGSLWYTTGDRERRERGGEGGKREEG